MILVWVNLSLGMGQSVTHTIFVFGSCSSLMRCRVSLVTFVTFTCCGFQVLDVAVAATCCRIVDLHCLAAGDSGVPTLQRVTTIQPSPTSKSLSKVGTLHRNDGTVQGIVC